MRNRLPALALSASLSASVWAQPVLYGVRANGDLLWINSLTGSTQLVGSSGIPCSAAAARTVYLGRDSDFFFLNTGGGAQPDQIANVVRWTGESSGTYSLTGRPPGYSIHALTAPPVFSHDLYALLHSANPGSPDLLVNITSDTFVGIGSTGRSDLQAIAISPTGAFFAIGPENGGSLYSLSGTTGLATLIGAGNFPDARGLTFAPHGRLLACGANLYSLNPATGAATLIGPTGVSDIQGIGAFSACYVDCITGGAPPELNVLDFTCFINRFASGSVYANCDESTVPPVLNVLDFVCFLNLWVSHDGC